MARGPLLPHRPSMRRLRRWFIPLALLAALTLGRPLLALGPTPIQAVYDERNSLRKASVRWPAFITTTQAVDTNSNTIKFQWDAGLPVDEWILDLGVVWETGEVRGTMSGSASLGDRVSQLYERCWASHAGECSGTADFSGTIVEGHAEPYGDKGQWRVCFVVEGTIDLKGEISHFRRPWTEGLAGDGTPIPENERIAIDRAEIQDYRQFFTGIIYPPDGERFTSPYLALMTKQAEPADTSDEIADPYLTGMGHVFVFSRGILPEKVPSPGPAIGVCEAAALSGAITPAANQSDVEPLPEADPSAIEEFSASIGIYPDPPVPGKVAVFRAQVSGEAADEALSYTWYVDGEMVGSDETAQWSATVGEHEVSLKVQSTLAEERGAIASSGFVVASPLATENADPAADAGWSMGTLACSEGITSDDTLTCTATWSRDQDSDLGALAVQWYIDGVLASWGNSVGQSASFSLDQPAPGSHTIQVQLTDSASDALAARSVTVDITRGANTGVPVTARATAALGSSATIGGWLWLEWRRAREAAALARRRAQAAEEQERALDKDRQAWFDAQMRRNDAERQRRQARERADALRAAEADYGQAASRAHELAKESADLTRQLQKLSADYDYTRYTAVSDGILDIADLVIDMGLSASGRAPGWTQTPAGAGAKSWAKGLVKGAVRQKIGESVDGRPADYDALAEALSAAGIPPDYATAPTSTASGRSWDRIAYDLAPRGAVKQAYTRYLDRIPSSPVQRLAKGVGPAESAITGIHDAAAKADEAARLRRRIVVVDQQLRRRNRLFDEALEDLTAKRSTLAHIQRAARTAKGSPR